MSETSLEDRAAIQDLFTRYCCALDNGEIETVVGCFTGGCQIFCVWESREALYVVAEAHGHGASD